jgi:MOSC domain-containing protein YiiM
MIKLLSIQVGRPRKVNWRRRIVTTGIYKDQVEGRIKLGRSNLEGDEQADLRVHGGWDKAVYVYPSEHYAFWRTELPGMHLPYGMFGENFTTEGVDERSVRIGDRFRIGGAVVEDHTTPRAVLQTRRAFWASPTCPNAFTRAAGAAFIWRCWRKVTWGQEMSGNASAEIQTRCPCTRATAVIFGKGAERRLEHQAANRLRSDC